MILAIVHSIGRRFGLARRLPRPGPLPVALPRRAMILRGALLSRGRARSLPRDRIAETIGPDHLVCLESGERVVLLGRHLARRFGMTPDQYRARWGLDPGYPMVAPGYVALRDATMRRMQKAAPDGSQSLETMLHLGGGAEGPEGRADAAERA